MLEFLHFWEYILLYVSMFVRLKTNVRKTFLSACYVTAESFNLISLFRVDISMTLKTQNYYTIYIVKFFDV